MYEYLLTTKIDYCHVDGFRFRMLSDENDNSCAITRCCMIRRCSISTISFSDRSNTRIAWLRSLRPTTAGRNSANLLFMDMDDSENAPAAMGKGDFGADHSRPPRPSDLSVRPVRRPGLLLELTGLTKPKTPPVDFARRLPDQYDPSKNRVDDEGSIFGGCDERFQRFRGATTTTTMPIKRLLVVVGPRVRARRT